MPITAVFNQGQYLAIETDRGSAPSGGRSRTGAGAEWWYGGRRIPIITDGLPGIDDKQETVFPTGHAGVRGANQQAPVVGRKWSEGDFSAPVVADLLTAILYGAMGTLSSNMVPSLGPSLLANEPIAATPKSLVLGTQPDAGGNVLRFDLKGNQSGTGTVSISGIDSYGNGASETINMASTGLFYTRTSWSSIAASGIVFTGWSVVGAGAASVTIFGIRNFTHTVSGASKAPTFTFERIGTPQAGNTASVSFIHPGMVITEMNLNTPAATPDGLFMLDATFEGDPTVTCTATSLNAASTLKVWPAWVFRLTRDGGTAYNRATDFNLNISTGARNLFAGAGSQGPQDSLFDKQEVTGDMTVYMQDEFETLRWKGASNMTLYARWYTDWKLTASQNVELGASLSIYYENLEVDEDDGAFVLKADWRTVQDANFGTGQFQVVSGIPGTCFGNTVI